MNIYHVPVTGKTKINRNVSAIREPFAYEKKERVETEKQVIRIQCGIDAGNQKHNKNKDTTWGKIHMFSSFSFLFFGFFFLAERAPLV